MVSEYDEHLLWLFAGERWLPLLGKSFQTFQSVFRWDDLGVTSFFDGQTCAQIDLQWKIISIHSCTQELISRF